MKALIHATVYDFHEFKENCYILFDETIVRVGPMDEFSDPGCEIIDCNNHWVMPGLVNGHTHVYSAFARGMSVPFHPDDFLELLEQLWWKLDRHLSIEAVYQSGIAAAIDYIRHGVTTIIDHHASGAIEGSLNALKHSIVEEAKMRGIFAFETSDRFDVDRCLVENMTFIEENHSQTSRGMFGLHASLSLSDETLEKVKKRIGDAPIHIHVAESELDQTMSIQQYGKRIVHRLKDHGLLNPGSILSHAIHVDAEERALIAASGCVVAINVTSNMNNGVGLPNVKALLDAQIPCIIGNDGISASIALDYLNVLYTAHHRDQTPNDFGFLSLIRMIQEGYRFASGLLGVLLGRIQEGYASDLLVVPYDPPTPPSKENAFGHVFFGMFQAFQPRHVFIQGEMVLRNFEIKTELSSKLPAVRKTAQQVWEKVKKGDRS